MNHAEQLIASYPENVQVTLLKLRKLIFEVAESLDIKNVEETLKWGEPSYLVKGGSTLRFDWKASKPEEYAMYFNCKTRLVETFREFYADELRFEGNRAIMFQLKDALPEEIIKHCIQVTLTYHKVKHFPTLGI